MFTPMVPLLNVRDRWKKLLLSSGPQFLRFLMQRKIGDLREKGEALHEECVGSEGVERRSVGIEHFK